MKQPIAMHETTRQYLFERIRTYAGSAIGSARAISAATGISYSTALSWAVGRQLPSTESMPLVLPLLGLYAKDCLRCHQFTVSESEHDPALCAECSRLHILVDGKVKKK